MHSKNVNEKAGPIWCDCESAAFDFYYNTYYRDKGLSEAANEQDGVKKDVVDRFIELSRP